MALKLQLVAHRGYAARYPENTLPALQAAVAAGAAWLEFDVQLTRDHVPVLLHDPTFDRTAGLAACVHELDYAALESIDVGYPELFAAQFAGTSVSSLANAVAWLQTCPGVMAFVEIKRHSIAAFGLSATVAAVLEALRPALDQCIIISFVAEVVAEVRRKAAVPTGWVVRHYDEQAQQQADALQPEYLFCNVDKLPPAPAELWPGKWDWVIYEIVTAEAALQLQARDVTYVETMAYGELATELAATAAP